MIFEIKVFIQKHFLPLKEQKICLGSIREDVFLHSFKVFIDSLLP